LSKKNKGFYLKEGCFENMSNGMGETVVDAKRSPAIRENRVLHRADALLGMIDSSMNESSDSKRQNYHNIIVYFA
jgi:hypothetical protein